MSGKKEKKKGGAIVPIIIIAGLAFLGFKSFVSVPATDNGVVTRFGKYNRMLDPGLHFVIPLVDSVYKVPIKTIQKEEFGYRTEEAGPRNTYGSDLPHESMMLTGDLNIIMVEWVVQYRIIDPKSWLFNVESRERNKTIRDISKAVMNSLVGDRTISDVMGPARDTISVLAKDAMNDKYTQIGLGISVSSVQLQNVVPPPEVQQAFEDVNIAIQDLNRLVNEGKEAYNKEIPRARGQADQILQQAKGYAAERVNKAEGDVARFNAVYSEYLKARDVTKRRLYLETIEEIFANSKNLTLIDKNLPSFLPLKDLGKKAQ